MNTAILLAAGSGRRMQAAISDKILAHLNGIEVFAYSIHAFLESGAIDAFTIAFRDELQREELISALLAIDLKNIPVSWVSGGKERQDSVIHALRAQPDNCEYVFIHDCARPLVTPGAIQAVRDAVVRDHAAVLAHSVPDTIKRIPDAERLERTELEDLERTRLWAMETPQAFRYTDIRKAYEQILAQGLHVTDDTAAAAIVGLKTTIVPNSTPNPKLTTPADLRYAEWLLACRAANNPGA